MFKIDDFTVINTTPKAPTEVWDWSMQHLGIEKIPYKGKYQRVAVLDTGCDKSHPDLLGQVDAKNFIKGNWGFSNWYDNHGHGTFCTGEIVAKENGYGMVGVAPFATAFHGKVLYGDAASEMKRPMGQVYKDIANAVRASVVEGCHVISMSIGAPDASPILEEALQFAVDNGVIPVAAAGNSRLTGSGVSYPACYKQVISVAAANKKDLPQWFSSIGDPTLTEEQQPEVAVASLEYYRGLLPGKMYGLMVGTSQATPIVAGMLLLWREAMQEKGMLPTGAEVMVEARKWLHRVANDTNKNGWDPEMGYGVLLIEDGEL